MARVSGRRTLETLSKVHRQGSCGHEGVCVLRQVRGCRGGSRVDGAIGGNGLGTRCASGERQPCQRRGDSLLPCDDSGADTTAEATVERLDPQVSDCGRVEGTLWYRINLAPDGTIVFDLQGAKFAPVLRVYDLLPNSLDELVCDSAKASGKATVSFRTQRGVSYLVLVGKRPGAADGAFSLTARLFLPPANDTFRQAKRIAHLPAKVTGSTFGATSDSVDPEACRLGGGTVWFALPKVSSERIAVRLTALGDLDASVAVVGQIRSKTGVAGCKATDRRGSAVLAVGLDPDAKYAIVIGQQEASAPGDFVLEVLAAQPAERAPGRYLARGQVRSTLNGLTDVNDMWWVTLLAGQTYRVALNSTGCPRLLLTGKQDEVRTIDCQGYTTFTPGPDGGGRYVIELRTTPTTKTVRYRLVVAPAGADDVGVGLALPNLATVRGALQPQKADLVDIYHFDVGERSDVRLRLANAAGYQMTLLTDEGGRVQSSGDQIRRQLDRGRYVVAVQSSVGKDAARYNLSLVVRALTATTLSASSSEVEPHSAVTLTTSTSPVPDSGWIGVQIDRFDPLTGWQFHRLYRVRAPGGTVTWTPPAAGRWRMRASYLGTLRFSPSRSSYVLVLVATPLPAGRAS